MSYRSCFSISDFKKQTKKNQHLLWMGHLFLLFFKFLNLMIGYFYSF